MSTDFGRHTFSYSSPATRKSLKVLLYSPAHKQLTHSIWPPSDCPSLWFMLNAWLHVCVINFHIVLYCIVFGLSLGLESSTSYSIHFFTQSVSSFRNTCPYHCSLFCCSCCCRMLHVRCDVSHLTADSTAEWSRIRPPSSFVRGQDSTM